MNPRYWSVTVGKYNKYSQDQSQQTISATTLIPHERYNVRTTDNDICLFKLANPIVYGQRVSPVCLPSQMAADGTMCYVTGWGDTRGKDHGMNLWNTLFSDGDVVPVPPMLPFVSKSSQHSFCTFWKNLVDTVSVNAYRFVLCFMTFHPIFSPGYYIRHWWWYSSKASCSPCHQLEHLQLSRMVQWGAHQ